MRRLLPIIAVALLVPITQGSGQQVAHRGATTSPTVALRLWLPDGEAQVRYWDRDSVDIEAALPPGVRLVGGVAEMAGKYAIEHEGPSATPLPRAKVVLTIPRGATLWVKSTMASTVVTGGAGQLDVLTVTGRTIVRDAAGAVSVESIEGDVELWRLTGTARVRGGAGDVALNDVFARVNVSTVSGDVAVNGGEVTQFIIPNGSLETLGGAVRVSGRQAPGGRLDIETHDGRIELRFIAGTLPQLLVDRSRQQAVDGQVARLGGSVANRIVSATSFKGTLNIGTLTGIR